MMRRKLIIALMAIVFLSKTGSAQTSYNYKNVQIRGGGFVTGLIFNPSEQNLLYARTDVGGAYRWNAATSTWIPLTDHLGRSDLSSSDENYTGVLGLATDPIDPNRVYLATGLYTSDWAGNGAVLRSTDRGATWSKTNLTIKLGGNENGRSAGEILQVDPNLNSKLYMGTSANGLWQSTDYGVNWSQVASFPVANAKVSFVQFRKNSGTTGSATPVIYVGLLQTGTNLYRSTDGGVTWSDITGAPTTVVRSGTTYNIMPHHAALSSTNILYIAYSSNTGPNDVSTGAIYKLNSTGVWARIDNTAGITYTQGGYAGISVDANAPNTIVVSTLNRWTPGDEIYRSTDGGSNWTAKLRTGTRVETSAPWASASSPHWIGDIEIDPFSSGKVWFVTGYGLYATDNITAGAPAWTFTNTGLEETVPSELVCPPSGASLLSAIGDIDGFRHTDLDAPPSARFTIYGTNTSIDFAQSNPNYVARTHRSSGGNMGAYSTNQGVSWTSFGSYPASGSGGVIAVAADASRMLWAPDNAAVSYSTNNGTIWTASTGINSKVAPEADRVNSNKFYAYDALNGNVLLSTNGGVSFSATTTGFAAVPDWYLWTAGIRAVFDREGDVWLHNANGLYHSTNSTASFTQIANVGGVYKIAFGKSKTLGGYPALYIVGFINGIYGYYRSDNTGASWTRINDDAHQFGGIRTLAADANIYGRFYLGTSGRGIIYGDPIVTLPLDLISFKATPINRNDKRFAHLQWQTANEVNTSHFIIEKSLNGSQWMEAGKRNSFSENGSYDFKDDISNASGTIFYRLQMVDRDGSKTFSRIIAIEAGDISASFVSAYPNPVTKGTFQLNINAAEKNTVVIKLSDANGKEIYRSSKTTVHKGQNTITVTALQNKPAGMYLVNIYAADGVKIGSLNLVKRSGF